MLFVVLINITNDYLWADWMEELFIRCRIWSGFFKCNIEITYSEILITFLKYNSSNCFILQQTYIFGPICISLDRSSNTGDSSKWKMSSEIIAYLCYLHIDVLPFCDCYRTDKFLEIPLCYKPPYLDAYA